MKRRRNRPDPEYSDGKRLGKNARALIRQSRRQSFRCIHCRNEVPTEALGTKHRNHCPLCLWSRHVDESVGDRKSSCLSSMKPIGLSIKEDGGELMIIHKCVRCSKICRNRIAADDNTVSVLDLFESSLTLFGEELKEIESANIELCVDRKTVKECLLGK